MALKFLVLLIISQSCMVESFVGPTVEFFVKSYGDCLTKSIAEVGILPSTLTCPAVIDGYGGCWVQTFRQKTSEIQCSFLSHYQDANYTRYCQPDGKWSSPDASQCTELPLEIKTERRHKLLLKYNLSTQKEIQKDIDRTNAVKNLETFEFTLRVIDAAFCLIAFVMLLVLIPLKNQRIFLHRNLLVALFARDICEITYLKADFKDNVTGCDVLTSFSHYFFIAQIAWMFNEGFFQFRQFYFVFITKHYIWVYAIFGWTFPGIFAGFLYPYLMTKHFTGKSCWKKHGTYHLAYLVYGPALILLALNLLILIFLMWTIWSKLKATPNVANKNLHRSRKAMRGFAILVILLGGGFVFTFYGPTPYVPFKYVRTVVPATQGLLVSVFYIFMSREVHDSFKRKHGRWSSSRNLSKSRTESSDFPSSRRTSLFQLPRKLSSTSRESVSTNGRYSRRNSDDFLGKQNFMAEINKSFQSEGDIKLHPIEETEDVKVENHEQNGSAVHSPSVSSESFTEEALYFEKEIEPEDSSNFDHNKTNSETLGTYENLDVLDAENSVGNGTPMARKPSPEGNRGLNFNPDEIGPEFGELRDIIAAYADRRNNETNDTKC